MPITSLEQILKRFSKTRDVKLFEAAAKELEDGAKQLEGAAAEIEEWRSCAKYDATMEGPKFKGWDMSALDRCRKKFIEGKSE